MLVQVPFSRVCASLAIAFAISVRVMGCVPRNWLLVVVRMPCRMVSAAAFAAQWLAGMSLGVCALIGAAAMRSAAVHGIRAILFLLCFVYPPACRIAGNSSSALPVPTATQLSGSSAT